MIIERNRRPFMAILFAFVIGVVVSRFLVLPLWANVVIPVLLYILAIVVRGAFKWVYMMAAIVTTAMGLTNLHMPLNNLPVQKPLILYMQLESEPYRDGDRLKAVAMVTQFNGGKEWEMAAQRVNLVIDTTLNLSLADRVIADAKVYPLRSNSESYLRLMSVRGVCGTVYLNKNNLLLKKEDRRVTLRLLSQQVQQWACNRLHRLGLSEESYWLASAMTLGVKSGGNRELKEAYSRTGTAHLLAISGLHTGFVFSIIWLFLWFAPLFRGGRAIRCIVGVVGLWLFALMTGLSASVVRAALMLSIVQIALSLSRRIDPYNVLAATIVLMLAANPLWMFDISFQLSVAAVTAILFYLPRVMRVVESSSRTTKWIWGVFMVGVVAQLGVVPLLCMNFGVLPIVGVIITPLLLVPCFCIVALTLAWVVLPIGALAPIISCMLEWCVGLQNRIVMAASAEHWAAIDMSLNQGDVACYYAALVASMIFVLWYENRIKIRGV